MATISNNDIAQAIYLSLKDKSSSELEKALRNVVRFLDKRKLLSRSREILSSFKKIVNQDKKVVEVKISSKQKIDNEIKKELISIFKKRYGEKEFIFLENFDEKLLGGFKIEIMDELIDLTFKNKIYKLQEYLIRNA